MDLRRRAQSSNPEVAFPALVKLGHATPIYPTTDTGYKSYGAGRLFLPAAANYHTNPSFETDTNSDGTADGVSMSVGTGSVVFSRVPGRNGGWAQRAVWTAGAGDSNTSRYLNILATPTAVGSFVQNDYGAISFYMRCSSSGLTARQMYLQATDAAGAGISGQSLTVNFSDSSDWVRISGSKQFTDATQSRLTCYFIFLGCDPGDTFTLDFDDVMIEKSSVITPYFDGTYPDCAWTGPAHASASTRTVSISSYQLANGFPNNGTTVAYRWTPSFTAAAGVPSGYPWFMKRTGAAATTTEVYMATGGGIYFYVTDAGGSSNVANATPGFTIGTTTSTVCRLGLTTLDLNHAGTTATQVAHSRVMDSDGVLYIGNKLDSTAFRHFVGPLLASPKRKSDAWTTAIQSSSGAAFNNPMRLWNEFMEPGDILFPLRNNSIGYIKTNKACACLPSGLDYSFTTTAASTDTGYEVYDG